MKRFVVFETGGNARRNNTFDRKAVGNVRYGWPACYLYEECLKRGIQLLTPDLYFEMTPKPARALYVRAAVRADEDVIIQSGARPAILAIYESPLAAPDFYFRLKRESARYDHSFLLGGAETLISPKTLYHKATAPNAYSARDLVEGDFGTRRYLTLVNSNVRARSLKRAYIALRNFVSPLPSFIPRELYVDRLEAIRYFSQYGDFDLYGYGWDRPVAHAGNIYEEAVRKSYRGAVDDKFTTLQNYKFALCFENAIFNGYISEKMIDAMAAGAIPVYWGAPDITDYIPEDAFIDYRKFHNFSHLDEYLRSINKTTYDRYVAAIRAFLVSDKYYFFSQEKYARDYIEAFESLL